jgi:hypothetical protein
VFEGYGVELAVAPVWSPHEPGPWSEEPGTRPSRLTDALQVDTWSTATKVHELERVQQLESMLAAYRSALVAELAGDRADFFDTPSQGGGERSASWSEGGLAGVGEFFVDELAQVLRCSVTEASVRAEQALLLTRHLRATWAALAEGRIDWPRARAIAAELAEPVRRGDRPTVVAAVEALVLPRAMDLGVQALRAAVRRELTRLDEGAAERRRREARQCSDVRVRPVGDGMSELVALLPHEKAVAIRNTADAHARMAREAGDPRPIGVIRTEVLTDLALRPWDDSRPPVTAHLTVHAPLTALQGRPGGEPAELDGQPITAAHLRELLEHLDGLCPGGLQVPAGGSVDVALTDPVSGRLRAVVPLRELRRLARRGCPDHLSGGCACPALDRPAPTDDYRPRRAQHRFVTTRDRTCRMPGCSVRAGHADLDHVLPHPEGATDCANLCCLCRRHHRLKTHGRGWRFTMDPDGVLTVTTPTGVTRVTRPPGLAAPSAEDPPF